MMLRISAEAAIAINPPSQTPGQSPVQGESSIAQKATNYNKSESQYAASR